MHQNFLSHFKIAAEDKSEAAFGDDIKGKFNHLANQIKKYSTVGSEYTRHLVLKILRMSMKLAISCHSISSPAHISPILFGLV